MTKDPETTDDLPESQPAKKSATKRQTSGRVKTIYGFLIVLFLTGIVLIVLACLALTPTEYVCGTSSPSLEEIQSRPDLPVCLKTSVRSKPLCLEAGLSADEPARWCQTNIRTSDTGNRYFLWWSSCEECGPAWRLFDNPHDDKESAYKLSTSEKPGPEDAPLTSTSPVSETQDLSSWLEWDPTNRVWEDAPDVWVEECQSTPDYETSDFLPSDCYVEKNNSVLLAIGGLLAGLSWAIVVVWKCCLNPGGKGSGSGGGLIGGGGAGGGC